eukprot:77274-Chlamydomonas_euryale.AAC.8
MHASSATGAEAEHVVARAVLCGTTAGDRHGRRRREASCGFRSLLSWPPPSATINVAQSTLPGFAASANTLPDLQHAIDAGGVVAVVRCCCCLLLFDVVVLYTP